MDGQRTIVIIQCQNVRGFVQSPALCGGKRPPSLAWPAAVCAMGGNRPMRSVAERFVVAETLG